VDCPRKSMLISVPHADTAHNSHQLKTILCIRPQFTGNPPPDKQLSHYK